MSGPLTILEGEREEWEPIDQEQADKLFERQLEEWRDQYHTIYMSDISEINFVWRGLSRAEHRKAVEYYEDDFKRAEYVCRLCVLEPVVADWDTDIPAGIPETLTRHILEESGFAEGSTKLKELQTTYEKEMERFDNQVSCVVKEVFSEFTLEEIDNWPLERTMWYFARAKWILAELRGTVLEEKAKEDPLFPS